VQQYERALARLAAGERGYVSADAGVHEAFRRAAADPATPLDQLLRTYGDTQVALAPDSRHRPDTPAAGVAAGAAAPPPADPATIDPPAIDPPAMASPAMAPPAMAPPPMAPLAMAPPAIDPPAMDPHTAEIAVPDDVLVPSAVGDGRGAPLTLHVVPEAPAAAPPAPVRYAVDGGAAVTAPMPAAGVPHGSTAAPGAAQPSSAAMPFPVRAPAPVVGGTCPHCGRPLPADRGVTFCPYCGENLTVRRCPACSTELEAGWRFCITCGREVDDPAAAAAGG
jgi:predicted RNA-binding Zn-ribbon protein involved in translation (DUF1610 family)